MILYGKTFFDTILKCRDIIIPKSLKTDNNFLDYKIEKLSLSY